MYLKELHLSGFKSFAQSVRLALDPGLTAVVGPNGSGKSNIVDAVRWVLGEQSARALRGTRSEDVIFNGTATRHPSGMAEVTLVLDNSDARVALDVADVAIARRLHRSGDTEYLLNRRTARLRDVMNLTARSGLGPDSYCVVGQGVIEQLTMQRPQERRSLIAAAADIRRYETRLAEIESQLTQAQQSAVRMSAVVAEIRPRLERMEAQAERAARHRRARAELEQVARTWFSYAIPHGRVALQTTAKRHTEIQNAVAEAGLQLDGLDRRHAPSRATVSVVRDQAAELERSLAEARTRREELRVRQAADAERHNAFNARLAEIRAGLSPIDEQRSAVRVRLEASESELNRAESNAGQGRVSSTQQTLMKADSRLAHARQREADTRRQLDDLHRRLVSLGREEVRLQARAEAALAAEQAMATTRAQLARRKAELARVIGTAERNADASALRATSADKQLADARLATERARRDAHDADERFTRMQRALDGLMGEARALEASLGAHSALSAQPSSLLTRFRVPGRYERALAAALGPAARYHVVDATPTAWFAGPEYPDSRSPDSDRRGAAQHDDRRTPWVLVPESRPSRDSDLTAFRRLVDGLLCGIVAYELAVDILEAPDDVDLAGRYLGATIIVDTLEDARQAASALTARGTSELPFQVATLDGQCLRSSGERVFGPDPADAQVIEVRARRSCVVEEIVEAEDRAKQAETRLARARASEARVLATLAAQEAEVQRAAAVASVAAQRLAMLQDERRQIDESLSHLAAADGTSSDPGQIRVVADRQAQVRAEMAPIEEVLRFRIADVKAAEEVRARAAEQHQAAALEQSRVDAQLAWLREIVERDRREIDRLTETERVLREKEALLELDLRTLAERGASLDQHLRTVEEEAEGLDVQASAAASAIADADASAAVLERERRDAQSALADLRADEARIGGDYERAQGMLDRLDVEVSSIAESLAVRPVDLVGNDRSGDGDPQAQLEFQHEPTDSAADALHRRLVRARSAYRDVGHVDYSVIAEYAALRDRYQHMTTQLDDLARTESAIRARMTELRERMQSQFLATFGEVNTRFREQFRHLFRGGDAELMLSGEPESPQCGIDIVAQPPGKRLHRLAALSGGERALAGAALLLALIGAKPSPFCMLDEVDAALDEANVHRFVATVREMAQLTQFILVTHNRTTIEMANALYGVTMTPGAVSQVVAITLPD